NVSCATVCLFFFFFFSSRRRHTRWPRDWSSDVCSSDLILCDGDQARGIGERSAAQREGEPFRRRVLLDLDALPAESCVRARVAGGACDLSRCGPVLFSASGTVD